MRILAQLSRRTLFKNPTRASASSFPAVIEADGEEESSSALTIKLFSDDDILGRLDVGRTDGLKDEERCWCKGVLLFW